jgi:hypothetical protein
VHLEEGKRERRKGGRERRVRERWRGGEKERERERHVITRLIVPVILLL